MFSYLIIAFLLLPANEHCVVGRVLQHIRSQYFVSSRSRWTVEPLAYHWLSEWNICTQIGLHHNIEADSVQCMSQIEPLKATQILHSTPSQSRITFRKPRLQSEPSYRLCLFRSSLGRRQITHGSGLRGQVFPPLTTTERQFLDWNAHLSTC
jgi:hypothetical protein